MSYAIIRFVTIGQALAKAFARTESKYPLQPRAIRKALPAAAAIIPKKLAEAVNADIVFLAVRFDSHKDVAKALPTWRVKTIIVVTNADGVSPRN